MKRQIVSHYDHVILYSNYVECHNVAVEVIPAMCQFWKNWIYCRVNSLCYYLSLVEIFWMVQTYKGLKYGYVKPAM